MGALKHKIDFVAVVTVEMANPNGDPLNGNRPRTDYEGLGEISDVCIKRKIRNRMQDMGGGKEVIFRDEHGAVTGLAQLLSIYPEAPAAAFYLGKCFFAAGISQCLPQNQVTCKGILYIEGHDRLHEPGMAAIDQCAGLAGCPGAGRLVTGMAGMFCTGCPHARSESIADACVAHGMDCDALVKALNEYFESKK